LRPPYVLIALEARLIAGANFGAEDKPFAIVAQFAPSRTASRVVSVFSYRLASRAPTITSPQRKGSAYSIDAICVGSLWCGDRTLPMAMPTKNIAASITAITPSFRGGERLRICLSKSSRSRRFIFTVPIFVYRKRSKTAVVSLTVVKQILGSAAEQILGSLIRLRSVVRWLSIRKGEVSISTALRGAGICQSLGGRPGLASVVQLHVDRCVAQRPLGLSAASAVRSFCKKPIEFQRNGGAAIIYPTPGLYRMSKSPTPISASWESFCK
jgi:hypothetical protein